MFCRYIAILILLFEQKCLGLHLTSYISERGIHGEITFYQDPEIATGLNHTAVYVSVNLYNRNELSDDETWTWFITQFPVDYSTLGQDRCNEKFIGSLVADLGDLFGPISFPKNETHVYFEFETNNDTFPLVGPKGIWQRSLILLGPSKQKACGTITITDAYEERIAEARFSSPTVSGSVFFRWAGSHKLNVSDSLIYSYLYHVTNHSSSQHSWKIYATDILDSDADKSRENCDFLQIVFADSGGGLELPIGQSRSRFSKNPRVLHRSPSLALLPSDILSGRRSLYLVLFHDTHGDSFYACAKIRLHRTTLVKALVQSDGIDGTVVVSQRTRFDPTWLVFNLTSLSNEVIASAGCQLHELPPEPSLGAADNRCAYTGHTYNPTDIEDKHFQKGTQEQYSAGDLSRKHDRLDFIGAVRTMWDVQLPLYDAHSVVHRSVVFYRYIENQIAIPWICGTLLRYRSISDKAAAVPMTTANVVFRYPLVGSVILRQPRDQPWADTTVITEMLVHADGTSLNSTFEHRWSINDLPPGKDFYNWTARCVSAGHVYNPYKVTWSADSSSHSCNPDNKSGCRLGDLSGRHGTFGIAGSKKQGASISRRIYTDPNLPLSGGVSIVGRSFVVYDDHGPKARGDRLACSKIQFVHRRKAVVKGWFSNGTPGTILGKIEMLQQTKYDVTDIDVAIEGLVDASGYHIHMAPVQEHLEFPCEDSTLHGHFNPLNVDPRRSPVNGTPDQYETGDLSGKFGFLDGKITLTGSYNDTSITLFGEQSVLGRSVVIHKKLNNRRWICSSIERGYAPSEARELRAIASFHHPGGFAFGYVRMTQLVYKDGSTSDTVMEVNLRHPGKQDRNFTRNHNWAVYVNPVSVDAAVKVLHTRCTAAGYIWNPYYTQLADPLNEDLYRSECGADNPLRCYVGDLSARLGTIDLGGQRKVFSDVNLPLEGKVSAMGRSVVIFTPERGSDRFACANIEPDKDIVKYANVRRTPQFVTSQFLEEVRQVMGIPDWFLTVDTRSTKNLYQGSCIQFLLHFKGPEANKLEQDFSKLMATGRLDQPSLYIVGHFESGKRKATISYQSCGSEDPQDSKPKSRFSFSTSSLPVASYFIVILQTIFILYCY